ncbi:DinB family protein (plasmid) [Deinococcus metallilatus]|uniref:DinB family protein n=1 Tax=Deinococcus metallilatus TaxID=1211322 RepID=A0AAJ5K6Z1_9DEIO|nr:DinB family protein [Deinococcus metallilatus]MBB5295620.1 hypothetical protein [Deinococcus metallilatus]QBY06916.1 DinB family protein [Deinococcus metallilatus]TLK32306.1 DinB family protein [Deinococcus metallilatus]GMA14149.1 hypothetical protein GCM10025871_04800 [Deinococcus metallilatus]
MTPRTPEEQLAALQAVYPTPEVVALQLDRELAALEETIRAAAPHWSTRMPGRDWTPAQEAEHAILVNEGTGKLVRLLLSDRPLREAPQQPGQTENGKRLAPPGTEPGAGEALDTLLTRHAAASALLAGVRADPNPDRTFFHPFMGKIDALDWLRMATWHTRHHRKAIQAGLDHLNAGERAEM